MYVGVMIALESSIYRISCMPLHLSNVAIRSECNFLLYSKNRGKEKKKRGDDAMDVWILMIEHTFSEIARIFSKNLITNRR